VESFVAVAEQNGLIQPLADLVVDKSIDELPKLLRTRPSFLSQNNEQRRFADAPFPERELIFSLNESRSTLQPIHQ
jgi:sensor c-di-GMP phosphodiesterase-like protein